MNKLRVIVVDDDENIRDALNSWLSWDYMVNCFSTAESLIMAFKNLSFDDGIPTCILMDLKMPNMNGIELQSELMLLNVSHPMIFMSGDANQTDIISAWHGGAIDFILKPFTASQISTSIVKAFNKQKNGNSLENATNNENGLVEIPITRREAQVLLLLGKGHQQIEVATLLGLSLRTVKMYRAFLKRKLGLNTQMELARYCDKHSKSIEALAMLKL
jgi:FixJ family two-component response regulator